MGFILMLYSDLGFAILSLSIAYFKVKIVVMKISVLKTSTRVGFEPTRGDPNGLAVHRLNHSATSSSIYIYIYIYI